MSTRFSDHFLNSDCLKADGDGNESMENPNAHENSIHRGSCASNCAALIMAILKPGAVKHGNRRRLIDSMA
jgi:hypothetical protein